MVEIGQTATVIWRFFPIIPRWRPSTILDLLCVCSDQPQRAFGGLYRCAKFGRNRCSSFHNMHVFRFRHFVGQALLNVSYSGITFFALFCFSCKSRFSKIALIRTVFLNQLIQFYSNNATKLHHLTTHSTTVLPHKMAIVLRPQMCDVISPYVYGIRRIFRSDHVSKACSRRASLRDCP